MKVLCPVLAGVLLAANANAGVIISFDEPTLAVGSTQTASFSGGLTNNGLDPVYLNGGESTGSIALFDVRLSTFLSQSPDMYSGTWSLLGRA
jgi:hypothetical protein